MITVILCIIDLSCKSEWLFNTKWTMCQLYHDENMLRLNEIRAMFSFY
jgi:hypothetical protein